MRAPQGTASTVVVVALALPEDAEAFPVVVADMAPRLLAKAQTVW